MIKLSTFVELINFPGGKFKWKFQTGQPYGAHLINKGRRDQGPYDDRRITLEAAAKALGEVLGQEILIDDPPETLHGTLQRAPVIYGEKRRRTGGHGYTGGDGFTRLP